MGGQHGVTNAALTGIKIEESDSQLIPKVPRKFLTRWNTSIYPPQHIGADLSPDLSLFFVIFASKVCLSNQSLIQI